MAQMHRSGAASTRRRAHLWLCASCSKCQHAARGRTDARWRTDATTRGTLPQQDRSSTSARPAACCTARTRSRRPCHAGCEVVELAPHAQRAEDVREGGPYFIACSDGQTRGPFGGADVVRLVAQGLAEKARGCALGRRVATGASSSSSSTKNPWKTTKLKHLRVHRWRATRFVPKQRRRAPSRRSRPPRRPRRRNSTRPGPTRRPSGPRKWSSSSPSSKRRSLPTGPSSRRREAPPPRPVRRAPRPPPRRPDGTARVAGSFDVRKFDDIAAQHGWKADDAEERRVALSKAGYRVGALGVVAGGVAAAVHFEVLKPTDAKHFVTAAVHLALDWCRRHLGLMRGRVVDLIPERWRPVVGGAADALADAADASTVAEVASINAEAAAAAAEAKRIACAAVDAARSSSIICCSRNRRGDGCRRRHGGERRGGDGGRGGRPKVIVQSHAAQASRHQQPRAYRGPNPLSSSGSGSCPPRARSRSERRGQLAAPDDHRHDRARARRSYFK